MSGLKGLPRGCQVLFLALDVLTTRFCAQVIVAIAEDHAAPHTGPSLRRTLSQEGNAADTANSQHGSDSSSAPVICEGSSLHSIQLQTRGIGDWHAELKDVGLAGMDAGPANGGVWQVAGNDVTSLKLSSWQCQRPVELQLRQVRLVAPARYLLAGKSVPLEVELSFSRTESDAQDKPSKYCPKPIAILSILCQEDNSSSSNPFLSGLQQFSGTGPFAGPAQILEDHLTDLNSSDSLFGNMEPLALWFNSNVSLQKGWAGSGCMEATRLIVSGPCDAPSHQLQWAEEIVVSDENFTAEQTTPISVKAYEVVITSHSEAWGMYSPRVLVERKIFFLSLYGIITISALIVILILFCCNSQSSSYVYGGDIKDFLLDTSLLTAWLLLLILIYLLLIVVLPFLAIWMGMANCVTGFRWEVHTTVFAWLVLSRLTEVGLFVYVDAIRGNTKMEKAVGVGSALVKIAGGCAAALDVYTDLNFVIIAYRCGCYLWKFSLAIYIVGVVVLQAGQGFWHLSQNWTVNKSPDRKNRELYAKNMRCGVMLKFLHMELLYKSFSGTIERGMGGSDGEPGNVVRYSCARCCCEDMLQGIVQIIYVCQFQKNYMVLFSIACSLLSSVFTTCAGIFNYLDATCE